MKTIKINANERKEKKVLAKEREKYHKFLLKKAKESFKEEKIANPSAYISLKNINKIYPNHVQTVYDFNLDIKKHEFIVFVGPSGCGKSTTLRMIAGLEDITYGDLFIDGVYANELEPKNRSIGMVFQNYALYPHMSVYDNMAFGLKVIHKSKEEIESRIKKASEILQITDYLDRKPSQLSGGQCQRVALGRAIVTDAKVFLMDEPLSNLDAKLRVAMRSEIVKLHNALKATTIYVTHDQTEAMSMANRIVVMNKGYIQQIGTPEEIFDKPSNMFVATFIGSPAMNLLKCKQDGDMVSLSNGFEIKLPTSSHENIHKFYIDQAKEYDEKLEYWKNTFLKREMESSSFLAINKNDVINPKKLSKYVSKLHDDIVSKLNTSKDKLISNSLDDLKYLVDFLREYLFEYNKIDNPIIIDLVKKDALLKEEVNTTTHNLILGIRPEHMFLGEKDESFKINCEVVEMQGSEYFIYSTLDGNNFVAKFDTSNTFTTGGEVYIKFKNDRFHLFDPITEKRINF